MKVTIFIVTWHKTIFSSLGLKALSTVWIINNISSELNRLGISAEMRRARIVRHRFSCKCVRVHVYVWERIISQCSDSAVRTGFSLESVEIDIERSESLGGASVTFGFLKNRRLAVSLRRGVLYTRNTIRIEFRERTFSTSTLATVELTPWCMYRCIHTSKIRRFRGSRGRPSRNAIPLANTARGWVSVLLISSPNYFELPLTAWERLPSIWRNARITPPPHAAVCWLPDFFSPEIPRLKQEFRPTEIPSSPRYRSRCSE